jgi:hypothetical protein
LVSRKLYVRERTDATHAEAVCCDAVLYAPSPDTSVFFLFNPFFGETMRRVVQNIRNSLIENPRNAAIVVCNPGNFTEATSGQDWFVERSTGKMVPPLTWSVFIARIKNR